MPKLHCHKSKRQSAETSKQISSWAEDQRNFSHGLPISRNRKGREVEIRADIKRRFDVVLLASATD